MSSEAFQPYYTSSLDFNDCDQGVYLVLNEVINAPPKCRVSSCGVMVNIDYIHNDSEHVIQRVSWNDGLYMRLAFREFAPIVGNWENHTYKTENQVTHDKSEHKTYLYTIATDENGKPPIYGQTNLNFPSLTIEQINKIEEYALMLVVDQRAQALEIFRSCKNAHGSDAAAEQAIDYIIRLTKGKG